MSQLDKLIKQKNSYTEDVPVKCESCNYCREDEGTSPDQVWDYVCTRNVDVHFTVSPQGRCSKYLKKVRKSRKN